jgi:hypothetical protein
MQPAKLKAAANATIYIKWSDFCTALGAGLTRLIGIRLASVRKFEVLP